MKQNYFKSLPNFASTNINVDRENGILKNTCVANFGDNKNGSYFDDVFINDLAKLGNAEEGGIKSRFGHPNECGTSFGTYIGRYRNFNVQNGNLFADLHIDNITKKTQVDGKGIMMFDYIMDMAETNPDMFGNSIHIYSEVYEKPIDGELKRLHNLKKFKAVDLVDDPAATDSLFSANSNDLGVIFTDFLDNNPKIFEVISKNPDIISDFFERYHNYSVRSKSLNTFDMKFLKNLQKKFAAEGNEEKFSLDLTLADGSIVTVETDAEQPQVGDNVVDDQGAPVADGEHLLPDGGAIVTVAGAITEMKDAPANTDPTMQEVMQSVNKLGTQFSALMKQFSTFQKENEAAFDLMATEINKTKKLVTSKKPEDFESQDEPGKGPAKTYDAEAAQKFRESRKK